MVLFDYIVAAIPMLGILVFVHEFGHFVVAKLCGVRVLKFSLGFGSPIGFGRHRLRWERHGTEYVISWIPLGGFVRMLGEAIPGDEEADLDIPQDARPDEYLDAKPAWQKIAITLAGPAMNLALPVVLLTGMLWVGMSKPDSVIGLVERASPAAEAGLEPGDRIVAIDDAPVRWWRQVQRRVRETPPGQDLQVSVNRGDQTLSLNLNVGGRDSLDPYGEAREVGWVGIGHDRLPAVIGVPQADSPAALLGLRSGEVILGVGDTETEDWDQWVQAYAAAPAGTVEVEVAEGLEEEAPREKRVIPALGSVSALGVIPAPILVGAVVPDMPAAEAGLAAGDLVLELDGRPVGSFHHFADTIRASGGVPLSLTFARQGETQTVELQAVQRTVPGLFGIDGMEETVYQIGLSHALATLPGSRGLDRERNPLVAVPRAVAMTGENIVAMLDGLGKMFSGQVGLEQVRGPITIVQFARKSLDLGWQAYLTMMIFISLNLGILNLLPIPILDGGQLVIHSIEGIKRAPISLRTREFVQQIGFVTLMFLMGLAFWNDLSAQWKKLVDWLSTGL
ncbi:MAG: RIP metalloprotease RseP [Myxococcota bacterium]|nr:RIP metalloprotease RseP [Myxococcota bacterium]